MTVQVIIPVFNRLSMTARVIDCLRAQRLDEPLRILVVDDGSSDGTAEYLASQPDVVTLKGDGSLWWGGAVELALQDILQQAKPSDWVLLVNNDTRFDDDFIQTLLDVARRTAPSAVGSVICDEDAPEKLLSIGAILDTWRLKVRDKLDAPRPRDRSLGPHPVDALSGRGTLYPMAAFHAAGTMKITRLPHYLADYELAVRVRRAGYRLIVAESAAVLSADDFGNAYKSQTFWKRLFSVRSASYLPAVVSFWWSASSAFERISLLPRIVYTSVARRRVPS